MKNQKSILGRVKAAAVGAVVAASALIAPVTVKDADVNAAASVNYAKALQYSLYLYDANMCGKGVDDNNLLKWRSNCHTYDSEVDTPYGKMDLSGGFHDAGDHAKFGLPGAYSATILGWSYYEFTDAFTQTGQAGHLKTITDYFCDYYRRCTVMDGGNVKAFCYQVGDGDVDHRSWQSPEKDTMARPATFADASNPATDVVAETAAALAMNYLNFGNKDDLTYAEALYKFAKTNNKSGHQEQSYYQGTSWLDDLALASIILYKATNDAGYKTDCGNWIQESNWAYSTKYPLCWDSVWPAANALYGEELNRLAENVDSTKDQTTSEGYSAINDWGSARYNAAAQMIGLVYDKYNKSSTYAEWAKGQMEYLFGNNRNGQCYMVGYDSNSVKFPHHRAASGYTDFPSENRGKDYANILVGALVGGPDKSGNYKDVPDEYTYTEVAVDYNAAFVGALAGLYLKYGAGQSIDPAVPGAKSSSSGPIDTPPTTQPPTDQPVQTTTTTTTVQTPPETQPTQPTQPNPPSGNGSENVVQVNKKVNREGGESEKSCEVELKELVPQGAKPRKFIVKISANGNIGDALSCGGGITLSGGNWEQIQPSSKSVNGSSATVEYDVASKSDQIDSQYGRFQFSYWWGDQAEVNVDSITCVYSGGSAPVVTTQATTTTAVITTTTTTSATTQPIQPPTQPTQPPTQPTQPPTEPPTQPTQPPTQPSTQPITQPGPDAVDPSRIKYGDVDLDGTIGLSDITALSKYILNKSSFGLTALQLENADCKHDGVVNTADLSAIIEFNLGKNIKLGI